MLDHFCPRPLDRERFLGPDVSESLSRVFMATIERWLLLIDVGLDPGKWIDRSEDLEVDRDERDIRYLGVSRLKSIKRRRREVVETWRERNGEGTWPDSDQARGLHRELWERDGGPLFSNMAFDESLNRSGAR